ncbi:MAG TPA: sugar phosphate isomerase/epimerase [Casimicrobiaceae bacterium]|nr:sugar phosphate isomerase/epimerase [Casimicrobiaceae bacterium]
MRVVSLDHLTIFELTPPELVRAAADSGYTHVGLRLKPAAPAEHQHPVVGDTPMRRETLAALRDCNVAALDWGVVRLKGGMVVADLEPWLETAAVLGARNAVVNGDEPDDARLTVLFAQLCELGRRFGMRFHIEPTPWTGLKTLAQASRIVAAAGQPNGKVMVDTIHVDRVGNTAADIAALPADQIVYAQLCDGTMPRPTDFDTMIFQARGERAFPGEGGIDLASMIRALPPGVPLSLECPTKYRALGMSALDRSKRGRSAVDQLLASL